MNQMKKFLIAILLIGSSEAFCMFNIAEIRAYENQMNKDSNKETSQEDTYTFLIPRYNPEAGPSFNIAEIRAFEKRMGKMSMREFFEQKMAESQSKLEHTKSVRVTQSIQTTPKKRKLTAQQKENKRRSL